MPACLAGRRALRMFGPLPRYCPGVPAGYVARITAII
jgi:hypothetical protein